MVFALGLAYFWVPSGSRTLCVFRITLGLPCPGCGLTRAASHLLHGDLAASIRLHPFALLLALEAATLWAVLGHRSHRALPIRLPQRIEGWALAHVVALVALWLGRLASGTAPF